VILIEVSYVDPDKAFCAVAVGCHAAAILSLQAFGGASSRSTAIRPTPLPSRIIDLLGFCVGWLRFAVLQTTRAAGPDFLDVVGQRFETFGDSPSLPVRGCRKPCQDLQTRLRLVWLLWSSSRACREGGGNLKVA